MSSRSPLELTVLGGSMYGLLPSSYFIPRQAPCQIGMPSSTPFRSSMSSSVALNVSSRFKNPQMVPGPQAQARFRMACPPTRSSKPVCVFVSNPLVLSFFLFGFSSPFSDGKGDFSRNAIN
ncbi:hypothetical protein SNK03_008173 [Fusarium graminearum]